MTKTAVILVRFYKKNIEKDVEVPLDITANELLIGLNSAYDLGIDIEDIRKCYLKMENPVALLHGNKLLREYGMHDCSIINITEE
jgi:uncharacterized ubiquitin-like protein YukD